MAKTIVRVERKESSRRQCGPTSVANQLAIAYQANGEIDEAIKLLKHVVDVQEKLAEDHPSRLASQHNLAVA